MEDARSLYINQLLNHYRDNSVIERIGSYRVKYQYPYPVCSEPIYKYFHHNEGIEFIKQYIKDLEEKVDELQYIERIIKAAKEDNHDQTPKRTTYDSHQRATHLFDWEDEPLSLPDW